MTTLMTLGLFIGTLAGLPPDAAAAGTTLRVDPPTTTVDGGEEFAVDIVQAADVATLGAQADIVFDPSLVQILDMKPGPAYGGGLFLYGSADGSSASVEAALADANATGVLQNVATFLLPGSGAVPPGDAIFVTLTMRAAVGAGGTSGLELDEMHMLDANSAELAVTGTGGDISVVASAVASGATGPSAAPSSSVKPLASGQVAGVTSDPGASGAPSSVSVAPTSLQIDPGEAVSIDLRLTAGAVTSGVVTDLTFDNDVLEITAVEQGPAWTGATIIAGGAAGQTLAGAIAQANETGVLTQVGVLRLSSALPAGEGVFLSIAVTGRVDGTSALTLTGLTVLDETGAALPVSVNNAELVVGSGGGAPLPMMIAGLIAVVALVGGAGFVMRARRRSEP